MANTDSIDQRPGSAAPGTVDFERGLALAERLLASDASAALREAESLLLVKRDERAYRLAASAFRAMGREEEAEAAELAGIKTATAKPLLQQAALADARGQSAEARRIALGYLEASPDDLLAQTLAAEASLKLWDLDGAEAMLRSVLKRAPTFLRGLTLLSTCLAKQARLREAIDLLQAVIERKPNNVPALSQLAQLSAESNDVERAVAAYEHMVTLNEADPNRWVYLAQSQRILGRSGDAVASFRKALSLDACHGAAWWGLTNYFRSELDEEDVLTIGRALDERKGAVDEGPLHIALGLVHDRSGNHAAAFHHFAEGKRLRLARQPYDPRTVTDEVDEMVLTLTREHYRRHQGDGNPDPSPIFIIGMPRSGSTLVERILGRHSQIEAGGELPILPRLWAHLRSISVAEPGRQVRTASALSGAELTSLGEKYVARSHDYRRSSRPRFTDKLNLNWLQVGLIRLALPNARIIDVRRGALDCCWANFRMLFAEGQPAANDLTHIGRFYRDYVRLIDAVDAASPGGILKMRYEDVVDDIESSTRQMLDFLELDYEPDCINFHLSTEAVATASSEQVRRPLNRQGIGSAEPYRQWLGPLIKELGPLA